MVRISNYVEVKYFIYFIIYKSTENISFYNINTNTLYGLSGLGDLVATCYSKYSRNREFGKLISQGTSLDIANNSIGMVSEGINSCKILIKIKNDNNLNMPICTEVYNILFKNHDPRISLDKLMNRYICLY